MLNSRLHVSCLTGAFAASKPSSMICKSRSRLRSFKDSSRSFSLAETLLRRVEHQQRFDRMDANNSLAITRFRARSQNTLFGRNIFRLSKPRNTFLIQQRSERKSVIETSNRISLSHRFWFAGLAVSSSNNRLSSSVTWPRRRSSVSPRKTSIELVAA